MTDGLRLASHETTTTNLLVLAESFEVLSEMPKTARADRYPGDDADPNGVAGPGGAEADGS